MILVIVQDNSLDNTVHGTGGLKRLRSDTSDDMIIVEAIQDPFASDSQAENVKRFDVFDVLRGYLQQRYGCLEHAGSYEVNMQCVISFSFICLFCLYVITILIKVCFF